MSYARPVCTLLLGLAASAPALADVDWFAGIWHNDLFVGTDGGGYTNGVYASWFDLASTNRDEYAEPWLTRPFSDWLLPGSEGLVEVSAYTLGQAMLTPKNIEDPEPDPNDAPYAGLLLFRSSYTVLNADVSDTLSVGLGIVGPSSGADEAQRVIHKMVGSTKPRGWDHQIRDEPVLQLERIRVWRFGPTPTEGPHADLLLLGVGSLGNLETTAGAAAIIRYGTRLQESFGTAAQIVGRVSHPMAINGGWQLYGGVSADYVLHQIYVRGSEWRSGREGDLRNDQYAAYGGVSYSWDNWSLTFSFVGNTNLDDRSSARQRFGTVKLGWKF